jgi:RHS repeat-associated protein
VYQLTDHLGNVRAVIAKQGTSAVALISATDYYPGGMAMPNRQIIGGEPYRYGYQGEFAETDPETGKPAFQLRLYDPRINRWTTTDPYGQHASPYMSMGNSWPNRVDPDGGCDEPGSSCGWFKRLFYSQDSQNQWDFWKDTGITSMDQVLNEVVVYDTEAWQSYRDGVRETFEFSQSLNDMGMSTYVTNNGREAMNSNINLLVGLALPTGKLVSTSSTTKGSTQGGLNLFKHGSSQATKSTWNVGDRFLRLPNRGTPKLNWKQNSGFLRQEMGRGKPIFDSFRLPNGNLIPTGGFLNAERSLLHTRGWIYSPNRGAWLPPGF